MYGQQNQHNRGERNMRSLSPQPRNPRRVKFVKCIACIGSRLDKSDISGYDTKAIMTKYIKSKTDDPIDFRIEAGGDDFIISKY